MTGRRKIFRSADPDRKLTEELPQGSKRLKSVDCGTYGGFVGHYEIDRFVDITWDEGPVRRRTLHCWLFVGEEQVGGFKIAEYQVDTFTSDEEFIDTMDGWSLSAASIALAMCDAWPDVTDSVTDYGSIVEFDRAWVAPGFARHSEWAEIANRVLSRVFRRRAILIMKAFPLEYEGNATPETDEASDRRQRAMMRLYARLFGVSPLPGKWGREGWLYAIPDRLKDVIPDPVSVESASCDAS